MEDGIDDLQPSRGAEGQDESQSDDFKSGSSATKMRCQVPGCTSDLLAEGKPYCLKKRLCTEHMRADAVQRRGHSDELLWRFCFQCGKLELLSQFDGAKRSCRIRLQKRRQPPKRCSSWGAGSTPKMQAIEPHADAMCMMYDAVDAPEDWMESEGVTEAQLQLQMQQQMQRLHLQHHHKQQLMQQQSMLMQQQHAAWPGATAVVPSAASVAAAAAAARNNRVQRVARRWSVASLQARLGASTCSTSSPLPSPLPALSGRQLSLPGQHMSLTSNGLTGLLPGFPGLQLPGQPPSPLSGQQLMLPGQQPGLSGQLSGQVANQPGQLPALPGFKQPVATTAAAAETLQVPQLCQPFVAPAHSSTAAAAASPAPAAGAAAPSLDGLLAAAATAGDAGSPMFGDDELEACLNELLADPTDLGLDEMELADFANASSLTTEVGGQLAAAAGPIPQQQQPQGLVPMAVADPGRLPPVLEDKSFVMNKPGEQQQMLMMLQQMEPYPAAAAAAAPGAAAGAWGGPSPQHCYSPQAHSSASSSAASAAGVDGTTAAVAAGATGMVHQQIAPQQFQQQLQQQLQSASGPAGPPATGMHSTLKFLSRCGNLAESVLAASMRNLAETVTRLDTETAHLLFKQLREVRAARKTAAAAAAANSASYSSSNSCVTGHQVGAMPVAMQQQQWQPAMPAPIQQVNAQPCNMP